MAKSRKPLNKSPEDLTKKAPGLEAKIIPYITSVIGGTQETSEYIYQIYQSHTEYIRGGGGERFLKLIENDPESMMVLMPAGIDPSIEDLDNITNYIKKISFGKKKERKQRSSNPLSNLTRAERMAAIRAQGLEQKRREKLQESHSFYTLDDITQAQNENPDLTAREIRKMLEKKFKEKHDPFSDEELEARRRRIFGDDEKPDPFSDKELEARRHRIFGDDYIKENQDDSVMDNYIQLISSRKILSADALFDKIVADEKDMEFINYVDSKGWDDEKGIDTLFNTYLGAHIKQSKFPILGSPLESLLQDIILNHNIHNASRILDKAIELADDDVFDYMEELGDILDTEMEIVSMYVSYLLGKDKVGSGKKRGRPSSGIAQPKKKKKKDEFNPDEDPWAFTGKIYAKRGVNANQKDVVKTATKGLLNRIMNMGAKALPKEKVAEFFQLATSLGYIVDGKVVKKNQFKQAYNDFINDYTGLDRKTRKDFFADMRSIGVMDGMKVLDRETYEREFEELKRRLGKA